MNEEGWEIDGIGKEGFGDARSMVNVYITRFSEKVSEAAGQVIQFSELDEEGYTSVCRGSATIGINVLEEQGILLFLARIMKVPKKRQIDLFRKLLELNYLATSDGAFAIDSETEMICIRALRSIEGLDYEEFEGMLHTIATLADEWDDKLTEEFGE